MKKMVFILTAISLTGCYSPSAKKAMRVYLQQNHGYEDLLLNDKKIWVDEVVSEPKAEGIAIRNLLKQALLEEGKGRFTVASNKDEADAVIRASSSGMKLEQGFLYGSGNACSGSMAGIRKSYPQVNLTMELYDTKTNSLIYFHNVSEKGTGRNSAKRIVKDILKVIKDIESRREDQKQAELAAKTTDKHGKFLGMF